MSRRPPASVVASRTDPGADLVALEIDGASARGTDGVIVSPNEETTLFRIANGGDCVHDLRETSVTRLIALALVEKHGTCLALTDLGREQLVQLARR